MATVVGGKFWFCRSGHMIVGAPGRWSVSSLTVNIKETL
ncbi:hypothetical protein BN381_80210 [Candidatus Microthrix parvicella RN1]|uniref:Uncharacterized protein n=1 Tax=Candidatus Neomicrothrix parvicella RN1 TaxID=1229780 RepID=R4Z4Q7_9ACTN|nr:hypothetical protein BN381_80210 [Candidatus Microthrix parvicella RN1]